MTSGPAPDSGNSPPEKSDPAKVDKDIADGTPAEQPPASSVTTPSPSSDPTDPIKDDKTKEPGKTIAPGSRPARAQQRLALLVGVDSYPHFPAVSRLRSCVNDAKLMAQVLRERFAFPEEATTLL